jgi:hypothetical protein
MSAPEASRVSSSPTMEVECNLVSEKSRQIIFKTDQEISQLRRAVGLPDDPSSLQRTYGNQWKIIKPIPFIQAPKLHRDS